MASLDLSPAASTPGVEEISADVADEQSTRAAVDHAAELFGGIDVVVNNAGIGARGTVEESPDEEFLRLFQVNVSASSIPAEPRFRISAARNTQRS